MEKQKSSRMKFRSTGEVRDAKWRRKAFGRVRNSSGRREGINRGGTGRRKDVVRLGEGLFVERKRRERLNSGDSGARRGVGEWFGSRRWENGMT